MKLSPISVVNCQMSANDTKLLPHQEKALRWMIECEQRTHLPPGGILADDMGLGKTIETISLIIGRPVHSTLIVVPANLLCQWKDELAKFSPKTRVFVNEMPESIDSPFVTLTTYIKAIRYSCIYSYDWDRVILDEAHYIRNPKGTVHNELCSISATHKWCLTGTPLQNYMSDIISLLMFVGHDKEDLQGELLEEIVDECILRRTKVALNIDMPMKTEEVVKVPMKSLQEHKMYKKLTTNCLFNESIHHLELLLRLRQASIFPQLVMNGYKKKQILGKDFEWKYSNSKLDAIIDTIVVNPDEKPIVFCFFIKEMEYLSEKLTEKGIAHRYINGSVKMDDRAKIIKESNVFNVLIVQMQAGSTGLNLQTFNSVHFTGPHWNPTHEEQAIARVYRIGQKNNVRVRRYILKDTIEEHIVKIQQAKHEMIKDILG